MSKEEMTLFEMHFFVYANILFGHNNTFQIFGRISRSLSQDPMHNFFFGNHMACVMKIFQCTSVDN